MNKINSIDLEKSQQEIILNILEHYVPEYEVWAFGSRVKHTARQFSDLDLAIITQEPLPFSLFAELIDAFSQSDLPIKVDVVDWACTEEDFKKLIELNHIKLKSASS